MDLQKINLNEFFEEYGGKLNFPEDLKIIIRESKEKELAAELENLSFKARYFVGLTRIVRVRNEQIEKDYYAKVENEMLVTVKDLIELLKKIVEGNGFVYGIFEEKFFRPTQECLKNLNGLCSDLGYFKYYLNDLKSR